MFKWKKGTEKEKWQCRNTWLEVDGFEGRKMGTGGKKYSWDLEAGRGKENISSLRWPKSNVALQALSSIRHISDFWPPEK